MKVKLSDIVNAIEMIDQYSECFLDKETGEIEWISDMAMTQTEQEEIYDRLDEHGFYRLPTSFDIRDYDIMENFVNTLSGSMYDRLDYGMTFKRHHMRGKRQDGVKRMALNTKSDLWKN